MLVRLGARKGERVYGSRICVKAGYATTVARDNVPVSRHNWCLYKARGKAEREY